MGTTRPERIAFALGLVSLAGLGFVPQFGGPGYEAALAAGLLLPALSAVATACSTVAGGFSPRAAFARGVYCGLALALGGLSITLLHGVRVGFCDAAEGVLLFWLGPGFGAVLGGVSGAVAGLVAERAASRAGRRKLLAILLAVGAPLGGVLVSLVRFYTSPMVFAYDPYFGYFSGPLYDTVIGSLWTLASYRVGTLATLCAAAASFALLERSEDGALGFALRQKPQLALAGALALCVSFGITLFGSELGHFSTRGDIERALGRSVSTARCEVVYSSAIPAADARRLADECRAHLTQLEGFFAARGPDNVRVFLFANEFEKGRWMGAAHTYIAKPWRREVYLQAAGYPHPVLGHELAHVVAGSFGRGPFHVAGPLAGWLPDPGRIEGIAMAAAPDEDDALTVEEWAAAMYRLALLPDLPSLFRLSFLGKNAGQAYTASGAFLRFLHRSFGAETLRRWYGGEELSSLTALGMDALEARWHRSLEALPLSEPALATARARFDRPAFFGRRCPRVIDRVARDANARLAANDVQGAREGYGEVLRLDARDPGARLGLASCAARSGGLPAASARYAAVAAATDAAPWARLVALEAEADLALRQGHLELALRGYRDLAAQSVDENRLRTLDVKQLARSGIARDAIVTLLVGDELGPSWDAAAAKLGEWAAREPDNGVADYLVGRNLMNRGRLTDASFYFDRALSRRLPEPRVLEEALRLRLIVGCATADRSAARSALGRLLSLPLATARREGIQRFAERCSL